MKDKIVGSKEINIKLSFNDLNLLLELLQNVEMPYKISSPIITSLKTQGDEELKKLENE